MRWFTDAAYDGAVDWDEMIERYFEHVRAIAPGLPPPLAALATEPTLNLHDAEIRFIEINRNGELVTIRANTGDLRLGYREVNLLFTGAQITPDNVQALAYAVGARYQTEHWGDTITVILAQEVDVLPDGRFVLRLRLSPFYEFAVEFTGLEVSSTPAGPHSRQPGVVRFR